jgi:hypothetical protein
LACLAEPIEALSHEAELVALTGIEPVYLP